MRSSFAALQSLLERRVRGELDRGATAVEYSLIIVLIAAVIVTAVTALGLRAEGLFGAPLDALAAVGISVGGK